MDTERVEKREITPENIVQKETKIENKQAKKEKRVGRITFGITLVLVGITIILQTFTAMDMLRYVLMMWPLILISLGIEVIYYGKKDNVNMKYDFVGIILVFIILMCTSIFSLVNYGVNKVLYNTDIQNAIIKESAEDRMTYNFDDKLTIVNLGDKKIRLRIIEDENFLQTKVSIDSNMKEDSLKEQNIISLITGKYSIHGFIDIDHYREEEVKNDEVKRDDEVENNRRSEEVEYHSFLTIDEFPEWLESLEIKIITNNKDNILTRGNFEIM